MIENQNQDAKHEDHNCDESCEHDVSEHEPAQVIEMLQELLKQSEAANEKLKKRNEDLTKAYQDLRNESEMRDHRHKKALEDSTKYACTDFAKVLIVGMDSLSMAMDLTKAMPTVYLGLKMTYDTLEQDMKKHDILKMYCELGSTPNPNLHQVIGELESDEYPEGTIVQVVQNGYIIHDRILRHASVKVAKGNAK
jgi:molecular chaperone GrpE